MVEQETQELVEHIKRNFKPTSRMKRTLAYKAQHPDASWRECMIAGGYSASTADKVGANFTGSLTVQALADEMRLSLYDEIGPDEIISKIKDQMNADKWYLSQTGPDFKDADYAARAKGIDLALKVLSFGQPTQTNQNNVQININTSKYTKE